MEPKKVRLAKTIGWFAIMASALSQEYGSGINVVATTSLGTYPSVGNLVPLAMFIAGLLLIPKVFMFQRFGRVAPSSGGEYVWMSRTIHPRVGFLIHFLYFAGIVAGMGFIAYAAGSTLASTLVDLGIKSGAWLATPIGHLVFGLALIWTIFAIHYSGVKSYGIFVTILVAFVIAAALISMVVGFNTSPVTFEASLSGKVFHGPIPKTTIPPLTYTAFFGTMTLFMFAYGGLSAAPLLGGEAKNPKRDMPRGIIMAWAMALVLFTLVAWAVFHVMPASDAITLIRSKHSYFATVPGILSLVAAPIIGDALSILVTIIIAKTIAPGMLATSRTLYAWSEDNILPKIFGHTNRFKAPEFSLFVVSLLASLFLMDAIIVGVSVVVVRSVSILLVIFFVGVGVLNTAHKKEKKDWEKEVSTLGMIIAAVAGIIVAIIMIPSIIIVPHVPLLLQPSFQVLLSLIIAEIIYESAAFYVKKKIGKNLSEEILKGLPLE